jgi:hypothetical protein
MIMNETKKLHLAIGDLADIESQDADGNTTGNFGDNDTPRALGVAIWNVQHEVWNQAVVAFEQDGTVYEVYVTPVFNEDIHGLKRCFEVKLEYAIPSTDVPHHLTTHTETVSYDETVKTLVTSELFK